MSEEKELMPLGRAEIQDLIDELYEYGVDIDEHGNPDILMKTVTELTRIRHIISRPQPIRKALSAPDGLDEVIKTFTMVLDKAEDGKVMNQQQFDMAFKALTKLKEMKGEYHGR